MPCSLFNLWLRGCLKSSAGPFFPCLVAQCRLRANVILHLERFIATYVVFLMLYWSLGGNGSFSLARLTVEKGVLSSKSPSQYQKGLRLILRCGKRGKALQGQTIDPLLRVLPVFHTEVHSFLWIVHLFLPLPCLLASFFFCSSSPKTRPEVLIM